MPLHAHYVGSSDPLQRRRAVPVALAAHPTSAHSTSVHAGLAAIAPRLGLVFLVAGLVQMLLHWIGR